MNVTDRQTTDDRQTDDRQTDDRQTDGRTTTYSERELEFTFAKNRTILSSFVWTQYQSVTEGQTDGRNPSS